VSRSRLGTGLAAGLAAALGALAGCGGGSGDAAPDPTAATTTTATAPGAPSTAAPDEEQRPGTVLDSERLDAPGIYGTVWRVRYRSTSVAGRPVEVTAIVARPSGAAPEGGHPVLAWAHGTSGVADECAPSAAGADGVVGLQVMLDAGFVVAATDYEGLGTPGVHPYLVSTSEGRSVLDAARAARQVADASEVVLALGVSQGGHAVLAASEIAGEWAPELDLAGTVAVAPAADLGIIVPATFRPSPLFGFAALVAAGWADAYEELSEDDVLGPSGLELAEAARQGSCISEVFDAAGRADEEGLVAVAPQDLPDWSRRIEENTIHPDRVSGPVLLVQGTADVVVPRQLTDQLASSFCAAGVEVRYSTYEGADHGSAVIAAFADIRQWGEDRLAGRPADTTC
jgi:pimeloyl-ACP methyl ester carboxylesterase